ncbi:MAG: hypothetical protein IPI88_08410 [Chitinophagaceae bacterium]|nr:hypothetical protein [Chitinophagaceae bacterium]
MLIVASIVVPILASAGWDVANINIDFDNEAVPYLFTFLFYLINYL